VHFLTMYSFWYTALITLHCNKSCICSQRVLLSMGEFVARNMWGWFKKINELKRCCISLVANIVKN
jgi:hypothetical protein